MSRNTGLVAGSEFYQNLRYCLHNSKEVNVCQEKSFLCCRTFTVCLLYTSRFVVPPFKLHYETTSLKIKKHGGSTFPELVYGYLILWNERLFLENLQLCRLFFYADVSNLFAYGGIRWKIEIKKILKKKGWLLPQKYPWEWLYGFLVACFSVKVIQIKPRLCFVVSHIDESFEVTLGVPTLKSILGSGIMLGILTQGKQAHWR